MSPYVLASVSPDHLDLDITFCTHSSRISLLTSINLSLASTSLDLDLSELKFPPVFCLSLFIFSVISSAREAQVSVDVAKNRVQRTRIRAAKKLKLKLCNSSRRLFLWILILVASSTLRIESFVRRSW